MINFKMGGVVSYKGKNYIVQAMDRNRPKLYVLLKDPKTEEILKDNFFGYVQWVDADELEELSFKGRSLQKERKK